VLTQSINGQVWDGQSANWIQSSRYQVRDSLQYFQKPVVEISDSSVVTISYQSSRMLGDSTKPDAGKLNLLTLDLRKQPLSWQSVNSSISDTNLFVREYDAAFGRNNFLYVLAQEEDTLTGINRVVRNGVSFGNPNMNLVLRSVQIASDMRTTLPVTLPQTPTSVVADYPNTSPQIEFINYPNPFSDKTIIEFKLPKSNFVKLEVLNVMGQSLGTLLNTNLQAGMYQTVFEAQSLASGTYICRLTIGNSVITKMMQVLR
jgi:hypothetical protein